MLRTATTDTHGGVAEFCPTNTTAKELHATHQHPHTPTDDQKSAETPLPPKLVGGTGV
jgi:hypothetical protein